MAGRAWWRRVGIAEIYADSCQPCSQRGRRVAGRVVPRDSSAGSRPGDPPSRQRNHRECPSGKLLPFESERPHRLGKRASVHTLPLAVALAGFRLACRTMGLFRATELGSSHANSTVGQNERSGLGGLLCHVPSARHRRMDLY